MTDLMPPNTQDIPTAPTKRGEVATIAASIPLNLLLPEWRDVALPLRKAPPVPKITIDEDCKPLSREDDIRTTRQSNDMLPKSIAYPMQPRPHCRLEIRVLLSDAGHQTASLLRREFVSHSPLPERRHHFF